MEWRYPVRILRAPIAMVVTVDPSINVKMGLIRKNDSQMCWILTNSCKLHFRKTESTGEILFIQGLYIPSALCRGGTSNPLESFESWFASCQEQAQPSSLKHDSQSRNVLLQRLRYPQIFEMMVDFFNVCDRSGFKKHFVPSPNAPSIRRCFISAEKRSKLSLHVCHTCGHLEPQNAFCTLSYGKRHSA